MNFVNNQVIIKGTSALLEYFYIIFKGKIRMELMVRPSRLESWNCRNRLMNCQGTVWNHPESKPEPKTFESGSTWNRPSPDRGHHYPHLNTTITPNFIKPSF